MTEPVRVYAEDDARLPAMLRKKLEELRASDFEHPLLSGTPTDYAEYQYYRGGIRALNLAIELCQEAEKELAG